jgi:hypothetical protein
MNEEEIIKKQVQILREVHRFLDNLKYELSSREYTLDEDQMGSIFYCRDKIWLVIQEYEKEMQAEGVDFSLRTDSIKEKFIDTLKQMNEIYKEELK